MIDVTAHIHHLAHVEDATIGARTRIWQFASVIRRAIIGADCNIASSAIVDGSTVGDHCIIGHGAFIGPGIDIGAEVFVGPAAVFCNDAWPLVAKTGWFRMADLLDRRVTVTRVQTGASIGAGAVIMPGLTIGARAMIAAGARVTYDVPADHLWRADGRLMPIDLDRANKRMRACS